MNQDDEIRIRRIALDNFHSIAIKAADITTPGTILLVGIGMTIIMGSVLIFRSIRSRL
jgi:hypothetical protein